jgi:hypothetical protein
MDRVKIISHAGKKIVSVDFSRCSVDEIRTVIERSQAFIHAHPKNSALTLTDVTDFEVGKLSTDVMRAYVNENKPFVKAAAVVGARGLAKTVIATMRILTRRQLAGFDDLDAAKAWLVSQ